MRPALLRLGIAAASVAVLVATVGTAFAGESGGSSAEARRVDRVATPVLHWAPCNEIAECASVELPLDYDRPAGETTTVGVLRVRARDQARKLGSLFVNPGGPGGASSDMALAAPRFMSAELLDRFDIVGVDPRGIGLSENLRCFPSAEEQSAAFAGLTVSFPWGRAEESAYISSAKKLGRACSTYGARIAGAMSTAEVVRDMDVMRRAVGDDKLTFLGLSYGTAVGQYYANMFPDRFRAIAVNGVIDPEAWVGDRATAGIVQDDRLLSADGAYKALREVLQRCDRAGEDRCPFAAGDPVRNFETIAAHLRVAPVTISDETGETFTVTYADFIGGVLGRLTAVEAGDEVTALAAQLWQAMFGPSPEAGRAALIERIRDARTRGDRADEFYDNGLEAYAGVACTDGLHPAEAERWPLLTARSDRRAPYFGRAWSWGSVPCAGNAFTVRDEDAYSGPFTTNTSAPVLFVGSFWDPSTNYRQAVSSHALLPNSGLLSSDNWGHTAYGSSACVTTATDNYLLTGQLPPSGTVCVGDYQPFSAPQTANRAAVTAHRPPVATPRPISLFNGNR